jgi:alpha-beta hydrolase superfamily lysophospholipase
METATDACTIETFTASDGYEWRYRRFAPRGEPRGRIVTLHGIQSHGGWYTGSSKFLADAGWEVSFLDRRGSGLNAQARGDAPGFRRLLADIAEFIRAQSGPSPFLLAISWGGKLAVALERFYPGLVRGLVLLTPGLCPRIRPPLGQRLRIAWSRLVAPSRHFPIPLDDPELFTSTPRWQEYIREDPLSLRTATARFLVSSVHLDIVLKRCPAHVRVPVLTLLAGHDRIIDNARTRAYVGRFATTDRRIIDYPDAHHTLEFEPDPAPMFEDVRRWLEEHAGG